MSGFFVGQRVRILWSNNWPELAGTEGTVTEIGTTLSVTSVFPGAAATRVRPDAWGDDLCPRVGNLGGNGYFSARSEQLEPLTDPGREVITWADCVWKPDHLRTPAEAAGQRAANARAMAQQALWRKP